MKVLPVLRTLIRENASTFVSMLLLVMPTGCWVVIMGILTADGGAAWDAFHATVTRPTQHGAANERHAKFSVASQQGAARAGDTASRPGELRWIR